MINETVTYSETELTEHIDYFNASAKVAFFNASMPIFKINGPTTVKSTV